MQLLKFLLYVAQGELCKRRNPSPVLKPMALECELGETLYLQYSSTIITDMRQNDNEESKSIPLHKEGGFSRTLLWFSRISLQEQLKEAAGWKGSARENENWV